MAKKAHISSAPNLTVGDRTLAICGKDFKVKYGTWDNVPDDHPFCRDCVETAVRALQELDSMRDTADEAHHRASRALVELGRALDNYGQDPLVDVITENREEFEAQQADKREAKQQKRKAKRTCTCTWTDPETFEENPDCPIHGHEEVEEIDLTGEEEK